MANVMVFPCCVPFHANNRRKTDPSMHALLGDFSDPKDQLTFSKERPLLYLSQLMREQILSHKNKGFWKF